MRERLRERSGSLLEHAEYLTEKGEIRIADSDWILMRSATFRDLVKGTERILRSGAEVIWLEAGRHAGREFTQAFLRKGMEPEEAPKFFEEFFTQGGWGKIQANVNFSKKEAVIRIENSATARQTKAKEPVCHFIRGYIAGICDVIFKSSTNCVETKCIAKGDTCCEFQIETGGARLRNRNPERIT